MAKLQQTAEAASVLSQRKKKKKSRKQTPEGKRDKQLTYTIGLNIKKVHLSNNRFAGQVT